MTRRRFTEGSASGLGGRARARAGHGPHVVAFLVFDGVAALDLVGPLEAFAAANDCVRAEERAPFYELVVAGLRAGSFVAESGLVLGAHGTPAELARVDTLVVPGGSGLREPPTLTSAVAAIRSIAPRARRIASVCTGLYGLAASDLLDGRRVTTHWRFVRDVAARFPSLRVEPDAIYVRDGRFYTSAGVTAGIDLSLALIEEDLGAKVALAAARELVVYLKRDGGQTQYAAPLELQVASADPVSATAAWVLRNLDADLSVEALSKRAHLSPRQFSRRFTEIFGATPAAFVETRRLEEARRRLDEGRASVADVARATGFRSADVFRRAFERRFGTRPRDYLRRFRAAATVELSPSPRERRVPGKSAE